MENLRITEKFARTLKAFRGRDYDKRPPEQFLVRVRDMEVFTWPKTQAEHYDFMVFNNKEWFVPGSTVDAQELYTRQQRVRQLRDQLDIASESDEAMRKRWAAELSGMHRSKIVLLFHRSDKKPLTREEVKEMLRPGDEILHVGMRYSGNGLGRDSLYVAVLSIPGTRNKDVEYKYGKSRWEKDGRASEVLDIEKTQYGKGDFSEHVEKVIY